MKRILIVCTTIFLAVAGCSKNATEPTVGSIVGRVTDAGTGQPITGAAVATTPASNTATTDANGHYQIVGIGAGGYTVSASRPGFASAAAAVTVYDDQATTADLALAATTAIPAVPVLMTPANGAVGLSITPTLNWNPAAGAAGYCVQIAPDTTFTNVIGAAGVTVNFVTCNTALSESTTYYWRVNAVNDYGTSAWSAAWSFTTGAASQGNPAPNRPVTPVGPAAAYRGQSASFRTSTTDPNGSNIYFRFDWGDGSPLVWSQYGYYSSPYSESHTYTTLGTFSVKAQAMDQLGAASPWSAATSITVANVPPSVPSYNNPSNGGNIYATYCTFQWSASDPEAPYDTVTCDLYVDTLNPPVRAVATGVATGSYYYSYYVSGMLATRQYYWRVLARDRSDATAEGPVWTFTTGTKK